MTLRFHWPVFSKYLLNSRQILLAPTVYLVMACSPKFSTSSPNAAISPIESLKLEAIYHASPAKEFDLNHSGHPTSDSRFPGGPAWFAPNKKALSIWRAAQLVADDPELLDETSSIYLHHYRLADDARILDLTHIESKYFFEELDRKYGRLEVQSIRKSAFLAKKYFDQNRDLDGFLIKDSASGIPELVLRNPADHLIIAGNPKAYEVDPEYSCFSCDPKRYIIRGPDNTYALIPDDNCLPGYYIQRIK